MVVPVEIPLTIPLVDPISAIDELDDDHKPPVFGSESVVLVPVQVTADPEMPNGEEVTVKVLVA